VTTPENMISQLSELCRKQGASEDDIAGFYLCDDLEESLGVAYAILIDQGIEPDRVDKLIQQLDLGN
jgi:hypothetical protein